MVPSITTLRKIVVRVALLLFFLVPSTYSQGEQKACPTLVIKTPGALVRDSTNVELSLVAVDGTNLESFPISWTVSQGAIIKGNGTPKVTFFPSKENAGTTITISAAVTGLPTGCKSTVSGYFDIAQRLPNETLDQFGKMSGNEIRARLDNLFMYLTRVPTYEGLLVIHFSNTATRAYKISRVKLMLAAIKFRRYDLQRISFYFDKDESEERTVVWTAPPGFDYSDIGIDESKLIKAEEIVGGLNKLFRN